MPLTTKHSPRLRLIAHRLLIAVPVLAGVTFVTFFILDVLPGNAARQLLGIDATAEQVAALEERLGLGRPAWARYLEWLANTLSGDLGKSFASGQPVTQLLAERFPASLELVAYAFVLSLAISVPLALLAARYPNGPIDRVTLVISMAGVSVASYVLALVLVLALAVKLAIFPSFGFVPIEESVLGNLGSLTLPSISLAFPLACFYIRFLRGDLLEQMRREDYVVTAIAKGVGPWRVLVAHAFRNSVFGLLTLVALNLSALIGGTVIIEQIFALPGMGKLLLQSIVTQDVAVVQALVIVLAVITVMANLGVDLLYTALDPRIRYGYQ